MKKLALLIRMPKALSKGCLACSTVAAISIALQCSWVAPANAQPDAQSGQKLCLSLLNLGSTADVVEFICKLKTEGSRAVVANYNQGGCRSILPADVIKQQMSSVTEAVMEKEKSEGKHKFCAGSANWDRSLNQNNASE